MWVTCILTPVRSLYVSAVCWEKFLSSPILLSLHPRSSRLFGTKLKGEDVVKKKSGDCFIVLINTASQYPVLLKANWFHLWSLSSKINSGTIWMCRQVFFFSLSKNIYLNDMAEFVHIFIFSSFLCNTISTMYQFNFIFFPVVVIKYFWILILEV